MRSGWNRSWQWEDVEEEVPQRWFSGVTKEDLSEQYSMGEERQEEG